MTLNGEMAVSGAHCLKVVDKAITIDNLRLLCLVVNVRKGTARRPRYTFLADLYIQNLMRSTCLAIVLALIYVILPNLVVSGRIA